MILREGHNKVGDIYLNLTAEDLARCVDDVEAALFVLNKIHNKDYMLVVDDVTAVVDGGAS